MNVILVIFAAGYDHIDPKAQRIACLKIDTAPVLGEVSDDKS